jgi:hypothetical protein
MTPATRHEWGNPASGLPGSYREFPRTQATRNPETSIPEITISYNRILAALKIGYLGLYRFHHPFWNERPKPGDGKCWCGVKIDSEYAVKFEFREPNFSVDEFWMPRTDTPENLPIAVGKHFCKMPKRRENLWWLDA